MRIRFAPDGKALYTLGGDGLVRTWRLPDGKEVPLPDGYIAPVFAWSRARNQMAVGDVHGRVDLWDATGMKITRTLAAKGEPIVRLAFSPAGRLLVAVDEQGLVRLWTLDTGEQVATFGGTEKLLRGAHNALQISDDETRLLVDTTFMVRMYRLPTGEVLWQAPQQNAGRFTLSPDGTTVYASTYNGPPTALYDADTFRRPVPLEQTPDTTAFPYFQFKSTFSPESRVLALGSPAGKVIFFDAATGKQLATVAAREEEVLHLGYTGGGTFLVAVNRTRAVLFDAVRFEKVAEAPFNVKASWAYGAATPGGVDRLLGLFRPADLPKADLESCWKRLDSPKPQDVLDALWQMSGAPDLGPFLREKVKPVAVPDGEAVRKLIADLDSPRFAAREAATRELGELGRPAEPFLRRALKASPPAEAVARINRLLAELRRPLTADEAREARAVFALETSGTAGARRTLEAWAGGAAGAHLTEEAKLALGRMGR
jgi:hypothetical protein